MEEKKLVPKLRFPGFTEPWEQHKFNDIVFKQSKISETELPYVEFEDINSGIGTLNKDISQKTGHKKGILFEAGDVLFGKLRPYLQNWLLCEFDGIAVGDFWVLRPQNVTSKFLYYLIQSEAYQSVANISSGTKMPRSNWTLVSETSFLIPKYEESRMIGEFFSFVDKNITLHQRKLEHLKLKKKSLLQKLFPKEGEVYPELRFPEFTDPWEQRKLGDFTNQINTFVNPEDAKLPLWSLTAEAGLIEKTDRYERDFLVKKKDQFKRIETNTLVYNPMNITIGSIDIYTGLYPIAVSGYYISIVYDKNIDTDFLKEVLLLPSSLKMYKNYATGSLIERQRVQYPTFSKLQLLFPNLDEQRAIGQLFKLLNLNITLHQRKLEHLQLLKKALLQQLFV